MDYILPVKGTGPNRSVSVAEHEAAVNVALTAIKTAAVAAASDPEVAEAMVAQVETLFDGVVGQVETLTDGAVAQVDALTAAAVAATGADRVQTGLDVAAADAGAARAEDALDAVTLASLIKGAARESTIAAAIIAGRGAVADGETFAAVGDDVDYLGLYLRTSSSAQSELAKIPKSNLVSGEINERTIRSEEAVAVAARAMTVRYPRHGIRPTGARLSWRPAPGDATPPAGWTWAGNTGDRWGWGADGVLRAVPDGQLRHDWAAPAFGGDGRWRGVWLNEPYRQQRCSAVALLGSTAGSPGTLPTGVAEVSGRAGLSRTMRVGTEAGVTYLELRYFGTANAASFDLDMGAAVSDYLDAAGATVASAAAQVWSFSAYAKLIAGGTGLQSVFPYVKQSTGEVSLGSHPVPLEDHYLPWFALRTLTGTPGGVNGGLRVFVSNGGAVDATIRFTLPQLEVGAGMTSPIPVANGRRFQETVRLPRNSDAFLNRWGTSRQATAYFEVIDPHWKQGASNRFFQLLDTSSGGRLSVGDSATNDNLFIGANWDGSAQTVLASQNSHFDLPGSIMRFAMSANETDIAMVRDNHRTWTAAGQVFTGTQPGGLDIGFPSFPRGMIFREIAIWDYAMAAPTLREMARNFENDLYVDTFDRPTAPAGSLGQAEGGVPAWEPYGTNPAFSETGRLGRVKDTELSVNFNDPAGGDVVIATYSRLVLPHAARRMGAQVVWRDIPARTVEIAQITLITTADERLRIAAITGAEGGSGSCHNNWLINSSRAQTFQGGSFTDRQTTSYTKMLYGQIGWIGQVFWGGRCFLSLPDGRLIEPTGSAALAALRGRYCTWEHFRSPVLVTDISNEVQMLAVSAS